MIVVDLYCDSLGTHLMQVYSGLYLLKKKKEIVLNCKVGLSVTKLRPNRQFIYMEVYEAGEKDKKKRCIYDLQDSVELGIPSILGDVDFYIKRSLSSESLKGIEPIYRNKVIPFGLNYQVLSFSMPFFLKILILEFVSRPYLFLNKKNRFHVSNLKATFFSLVYKDKGAHLTHEELSPVATEKNKAKILFQCRLWDTEGVASSNVEDACLVNSSRIRLIKRLRAEFGDDVVGGLQNTEYARRVAPELISEFPSKRRDYIKLVRESSIVISTAGLLGSNGWKLAEYVALGKSIVSEPIGSLLPGFFLPNNNYIPFSSEDECVASIKRLLNNHELIKRMEKKNSDYYYSNLEPSRLMLAHLTAVLGR